MTVPIFYHESSLRHETGPHPENVRRISTTLDHLKTTAPDGAFREVRPATTAQIARVHSERHIEVVRRVVAAGGGHLDADTVVSEGPFEAALHAAGAVLSAIDEVLGGAAATAFSLVRPPGHHARKETAMGFCLFNNVAVGAAYLLAEKSLERVAIIDWDVHHGNGTQESFYGNPAVFYLSLHRHPFYPGTGLSRERGAAEGEGTTLNVPLGAGTPREDYVRIFAEAMGEVAAFRPEFVIISAGFDAYRLDPIGGLNLEPDDFGTLAEEVRRACPDAKGVVSALEGGYDLDGLPRCVAAHLEGLEG